MRVLISLLVVLSLSLIELPGLQSGRCRPPPPPSRRRRAPAAVHGVQGRKKKRAAKPRKAKTVVKKTGEGEEERPRLRAVAGYGAGVAVDQRMRTSFSQSFSGSAGGGGMPGFAPAAILMREAIKLSASPASTCRNTRRRAGSVGRSRRSMHSPASSKRCK